ncbi:MAG TPA: signal peptidase I, partial [Polyangiaceae bacterium]|nr:signal peptidase I [Polyangiaceae bacterium]
QEDALGGALGGVELEAVALPRGVRIATHAALADVDGAPTPLAKRLAELLAHAESAGVADLAPGGSYEFWFEHGALSLRTGLHSPDEATRAALWLKRAFGAEPSGRLETFEVAAEGGTLNVRAPNLAVDEALLLRRNVLEAFRIPSASMLPTLLPGDLLFALKGPAAHTAARGDLVVFTSSRDPPQDFVKRVIGVGGDHVELDGYGVRINGTPLVTKLETADFVAQGDDTVRGELWSESVGGHSYRVLHDASHAWRDKVDTTVEPDHVFLLGDNRDNSMDSRQFGSVPLTALKGRVALIWASFDDQGVRWDRFGTEPE